MLCSVSSRLQIRLFLLTNGFGIGNNRFPKAGVNRAKSSLTLFPLRKMFPNYVPISGATKSVYAPEPFDVGRVLHADIIYDGHSLSLSTVGKIDPGSLLCYLL